MEMCYKNKDMTRYLDVVFDAEEQRDATAYEYQIKMIEANHIPYLLEVCVIHMDNKWELRYLTENCHVFSRRFQYFRMDGTVFLDVMTQIGKCVDTLSLYLLSAENLVLDPDYVFYDEEEQCVRLVYIPGYRRNYRTQMKQLLEYMMRVFDSADRDGIQQLYMVYSELGEESWNSACMRQRLSDKAMQSMRHDSFCERQECLGEPETFTKITCDEADSSKEKIHQKIRQLGILQKSVLGLNIALVLFSIIFYLFGQRAYFWLYFAAAGCVLFAIFCAYAFAEEQENADEAMEEYKRYENAGTGVTDNLYSFDNLYKPDTQCVVDNAYEKYMSGHTDNIENESPVHALVPLTNGSLEEIVFSEYGEKIVVGRGKNETDYRLPTTEINRVHAYIYNKRGGVYLEDMESQNGTFLNSVRIPSKEIKKLNRGDIVGFASEEFFVS